MTRKVLLVDDSGMARRSTRRILEAAGNEVVEAKMGFPPSSDISSKSRAL